jgi:FlaG/FlaF family flagellin (archaellin)
MAGLFGRAVTAQVALSAATAKTVLQLIAASNHRVKVLRISVGFTGVSTTDEPVQVDIYKQTTGGTMSSLTPSKDNSNDDETLQTTAQHTASAEPTSTDLLDSKPVHPQGRADFGPFVIPGGGRIGVKITAPNAVDCIAAAFFEE